MANNTYEWHGQQWSKTGCAGTYKAAGWYSGDTLIQSSYINPTTGKAYTPQELAGSGGGSTTPIEGSASMDSGGTTPTTTPTLTEGVGPGGWTYEEYLAQAPEGTPEEDVKAHWLAMVGANQHVGETRPEIGPGEGGTTADTVSGVPALAPYTPSAEATALAEQVGGAISDILEQGGLGIGEEVKEDLFLREAEMINASNAQSIKNMEDEMARRGMSNSGQVFSETMKLNSKSDIQMANVMRDVEIADAYMKLASYENAIGMGVQFLSYLGEESWRQYQPTLYQWQAQVDMYKMSIQQSYAVGNMKLAHQQAMELAQFEASTAIQLEEMQLEAANAAAASQGIGNIFGTILGWLIPGS